ncbi:MAG TPA: HAD family hydrolase [Chloroflexaceae bacterium]|nr:HAD family hydrolase [Chloroflexaceae bacterium]
MAQLRGVIIDLDGTLIASNDAHARAWVDALAEHSHQVPFDRVRPLMGMGGDNLLPTLVGIEKDTPAGEAISARRKEILKERYLDAVEPTPGARALLERMRAEGLRLVLATSAAEDELEPLLAIAGVGDLIEQQTTSSDAESSKPDPDIVQAALDRLGFAPDEVAMLGDTPYDVEAAGACGIATVALRSGGFSDADLAGARAVYDDPADLLARYERSPLAA